VHAGQVYVGAATVAAGGDDRASCGDAAEVSTAAQKTTTTTTTLVLVRTLQHDADAQTRCSRKNQPPSSRGRGAEGVSCPPRAQQGAKRPHRKYFHHHHHHHHFICPIIQQYAHLHRYNLQTGCACACSTGMHIGATWRIRLNDPCAAAMRSRVRLL